MTVKELLNSLKTNSDMSISIKAPDTSYVDIIKNLQSAIIYYGHYEVKMYDIRNNVLNIYICMNDKKDSNILLIDLLSIMNKDTTVGIQYDKDILISGKVSVILEKCKILLQQRVVYINNDPDHFFIEIDGNVTK